ncbi:FxSxx-COOH system tetratricopeptide repeat protein [Saccharothrix xinjiangensis]|uniref:FxSxx-COOH system tetratricopeptide repeat protein n=1 Tax=Saccharothrix xinjiangensis TaxID=204798 RepID=UPI0031CEB3C2
MTDLRTRGGAPARSPLIAAFTSAANGVGCAGVVANLAWLLAAAGNRVAVADWGAETSRVHDYLGPFHIAGPPVREFLAEVVRPRRAGLPADRAFDDELFPSLVVSRCRLPGGAGRLDVVSPRDPASPVRGFSGDHGGPGEVERLRDGIRRSDYDFVLVDAPTDLSADAAGRLARLCDVVAVCFPPVTGAVRRAVGIAGDVWDSTLAGVRLLAVSLGLDQDDADAARSRQGAAEVDAAFRRVLAEKGEGRRMSTAAVPMPRHPYGSHLDTTLAVIADDDEGSHREAYRRLAAAVADRQVAPVPLPPEFLASYLHAVGLAAPTGPARVVLAHAPGDRPWADWAESQFSLAGALVTRFEGALPPGATAVVVHSPAFAGSARGLALASALRDSPGTPVVVVAPTAGAAPGEFTGATVVELDDVTDPAEARTRLLAPFPVVPVATGTGVRFPRLAPRLDDLPPPPSPFVGREDEIEGIRDHLTAEPGPRTWWVTGPAGVGKSELAREYARRFAFDYEHVWWVRAHDRQSITASLARLAGRLKLTEGGDAVERVLARLSTADEGSRWLLVYDNADDPEALHDLVPAAGAGHVLVTSRALDPAPVRLGAFRPAESEALLLARVRDLPGEAAEEVAEAVGHLPLALHLVACRLEDAAAAHRGRGEPSADAASLAAAEFLEALEDGARRGAAGALRVVLDELAARPLGRRVLRVAQLCAFLGEEGVASRLLHSPPFLAAPAGAGEEPWDDLELDRVLWAGVRAGLFRLTAAQPASLVVHRLVLELLRDLMDEDELVERRTAVLRALAAAAPTEAEIDNFDRVADLRELRGHIVPSGAPACELPEVRRWLVDQLRFFLLDGDPEVWRFAAGLARSLLDGWDEAEHVELRMRLRFHLANLERALGQDKEALHLDEALLDDQRRVLGLHHPRTLRTARSVAQGLRVIGDFYSALTEEHATINGFRAVLGRDHPDTLRAANNLAFSLYLSGFTEEALAVQREIREQRLRLLGPDHPDVWWSACSTGTYLRELGRYEEALTVLQEASVRIISIGSGNSRYELRVQWSKGAALRRMSVDPRPELRVRADPLAALEVLTDTSREYRKLYGQHHTDTRACLLSFAAAHHAAGDAATAVGLSRQCLDGYHRHHGVFHPFTLLCRLDHAVFLNADGRTEAALRAADEAYEGLRTRLGPVHPWSLAAAANRARIRGAADDVQLARDQLGTIYEHCLDHLEAEHPITLTVRANLGSDDPAQWKDVVLDAPEM